jgi:hypothetical protein
MAAKPGGGTCLIREQIIEDKASGLTLHFVLKDDGTARLYIIGDALPLGNRELVFDPEGNLGATGTALTEVSKPCWLKRVV